MILINVEEKDPSLERIIDWLDYLRANYNLINESQTELNIETIELSSKGITIKSDNFDFNDCYVYWNRRSQLVKYTVKSKLSDLEYNIEMGYLDRFLNGFLERNAVNKYNDNFTNKLFNLQIASDIDLKIPDTIITQKLTDLIEFYKKHRGSIINKSIDSKSYFFQSKGNTLTTLIDDYTLKNVPEYFVPSLFQEQLQKKYELRCFYFYRKMYSMAIFSQLDEQTKIDFRNYNYEKPNRCVPYKLPDYIEVKIEMLMNKLSLNTGSIDLVFTTDNEYYFLEVNPVGMFSPLTWPLNYTIEKDIAIFLANQNNLHGTSS